jgi:uncharacterized membrane protein
LRYINKGDVELDSDQALKKLRKFTKIIHPVIFTVIIGFFILAIISETV